MTDIPGAVNDTAHAIAIWKVTDLKTSGVRATARHQQILTTTHLLNRKLTMRGWGTNDSHEYLRTGLLSVNEHAVCGGITLVAIFLDRVSKDGRYVAERFLLRIIPWGESGDCDSPVTGLPIWYPPCRSQWILATVGAFRSYKGMIRFREVMSEWWFSFIGGHRSSCSNK